MKATRQYINQWQRSSLKELNIITTLVGQVETSEAPAMLKGQFGTTVQTQAFHYMGTNTN